MHVVYNMKPSGRHFSVPTGKDLLQLRLEKGLSQAGLAKLAGQGFSQPLIARIENGDVNPPLSKVRRLLEVLYNDALENTPSARSLAVSPVITASETDTVSAVIEIMGGKGVSQLPVVDARGRVVGSVSEKVLAEQVMKQGKNALFKPVSTIMEVPLLEIDGGASIDVVQDQLSNNPALLVKAGEKVHGIITRADLLRFFGKLKK